MGQLVSRRSMLLGSLAAGAAVAVAGVVHLPAPGSGRRILGVAEVMIVAAVADTMFPAGPLGLSGVEAGVVEEVDRIVGDDLPPIHAAGFRYLLRALEWGPLYSHGARFTQLDAAQRIEVLTIWGDPGLLPRRIASDALKMVMAMAYFKNQRVLDAIGYRQACRGGVA
ncbi:MAG TPA: gluconate 2-dehydrogenase subunit 3 family protein [Myxococcota bacterium]|nr:gluconate 2-dehydrogenase subunit 3 family protein [Myxococcota bacterium]